MSPPSSSGEVLIVGMSRSGTTVIADILRAADNVHVEMEPHLIWKAGDFDHVNDEDHPRDENAYEWIRTRLTQESAGRLLIEKSPPNCLRPQTVHRVFPNARVIYVLRDPEACLHSNYSKSIVRHALSPRIALRKYLLPATPTVQQTSFASDKEALGGRVLWKQLRLTDARSFLNYSIKLWQFRRHGASLPFGPKMSGFEDMVRDVGLLGYHAQCMMMAAQKALIFRERYCEAMHVVTLEELVANPEVVVEKMLDFAGCDIPTNKLERLIDGLQERQDKASVPSEFAERLALAVSPQWATQMAALAAALE